LSDAGLKHVAAMKSLKSLDLRSTKITDAGLKELEIMKQLEGLDVSETSVTKQGADGLRKALPKVSTRR
jgi:hypothetical protein